jgi:tetratricopeptide (TPR) repeat protein
VKLHPSDAVLEEFLLSLSDSHRSVVEHIARCSACRARLMYLPRRGEREPAGSPVSDYGTTIERTAARLEELSFDLEQERYEAPGLFVELIETPPEKLDLLLRNSSRFHTWGLFELLVERCWEVTISDPRGAKTFGHLALRLAEHLDRERYRADMIADLTARAWAYLANARRACSDLRGAEEAFDSARAHLKRGTGDPLEQAILLDLEASLLRAQRRWKGAVRSLDRAIGIFKKIGDLHRAGRSMVKLATVHYYTGDPETAIDCLGQATDLLDPEREPRLLVCAKHNLIDYLAELGRFSESWDLYQETRQLYRQFPDAWTQNRRKWVKGKIVRGRGQKVEAERLFLAARDGFLAEGVPYDTALVSVELASLYAEQGRTADLKRLAQEMFPIFASLHIHREALAALGFLRQAAETERASQTVVEKVAAFLKRARHDPGLRFQAPPD